jgi:hypothetical protein
MNRPLFETRGDAELLTIFLRLRACYVGHARWYRLATNLAHRGDLRGMVM